MVYSKYRIDIIKVKREENEAIKINSKYEVIRISYIRYYNFS